MHDAVRRGIESKTIAPTSDVQNVLQPGDIGVWDGSGTQLAGAAKAKVQSLEFLKQVRNDTIIELATLGGGMFFRIGDEAADFVSDANEINRLRTARRHVGARTQVSSSPAIWLELINKSGDSWPQTGE